MPTLTNNIADSIGQFYLGQDVYPELTQGQATLYDAADLTTHAVIIGMTGSGKTGLGIIASGIRRIILECWCILISVSGVWRLSPIEASIAM